MSSYSYKTVLCQVSCSSLLTSLCPIRQFDLRTAVAAKASLRKARRCGLRHITSAMTTTMIGAILAASTVRAQQSDQPRDEVANRSALSDRAPTAIRARKTSGDLLYGMTPTRGARYLLRNGLDYLNYKEYERALKFLREAESRKDELNAAEELVLKKGIDSAQRGLRQPADAESPYALSERSRNRNGFSPSKPEMYIANQADQSPILIGRSAFDKPNGGTSPANSDRDDRGEPIRLASVDAISSNFSTQDPVITQSRRKASNLPAAQRDSDQPRSFPEISKLSQRTDTTNVSPSEIEKTVDRSRKHSLDHTNVQQKGTTITGEVRLEALDSALIPVSSSPLPSASNASELVRPISAEFTPPETQNQTALKLAAAPTPLLSAEATRLLNAGTELTHNETEDVGERETPEQSASVTVTPFTSYDATSKDMPSGDDLPPLPTGLGRPADVADQKQRRSSASTVPSVMTTPPSVDGLPPLQANVSRPFGQSNSEADPIPAALQDSPSPASDLTTAERLKALPRNLGSPESRVGSSMSGGVQASLTTAPAVIRNSAVKPSEVAPGTMAPDPVGYKKEEVTAVSPVIAYSDINTANKPLPVTVQPPAVSAPISAARTELCSATTELPQVPTNERVGLPRPEPGQESPTSDSSVNSTLPGAPPMRRRSVIYHRYRPNPTRSSPNAQSHPQHFVQS